MISMHQKIKPKMIALIIFKHFHVCPEKNVERTIEKTKSANGGFKNARSSHFNRR